MHTHPRLCWLCYIIQLLLREQGTGAGFKEPYCTNLGLPNVREGSLMLVLIRVCETDSFLSEWLKMQLFFFKELDYDNK